MDISTFDHSDLSDGYAAPFSAGRGESRSSLFTPEGIPMFALRAKIGPNTEIEWVDEHGDEGIVVLAGTIETSLGVCATGGAVVVEAGFAGSVRALESTELLHVGSTVPASPDDGALGPPATGGLRLHVVGPGGTHTGCTVDDDGIETTGDFFADGTCPTCRLSLFRLETSHGPYVNRSHSHSENEIIHVTRGELRMGPTQVSAGMSIAIPQNHRYGYRANSQLTFLNYRRNVSFLTHRPGDDTIVETIAGFGLAPVAT